MTVINTNIKSVIAANSLKINGRDMANAMEQLSTGKRINSASDDAAGLAITQSMTAQSRGLNVAVRNANDAISMAQTAEGALIEVSNMLQRMRELAVQASTGTISTTQRGYLATEATALADQIDSTIANTRWNGISVLSNASMTTGIDIQISDAGASLSLAKTGAVTDATAAANGVSTWTLALGANHGFAQNDVVFVTATSAVGGVTLSHKVTLLSANQNAPGSITFSATGITGGALTGQTGGGTVVVTKLNTSALMTLKGDSLATVAKTTLLATGASDMADAAKSSAAIAKIDTGLEAVNKARATLGASVNRLTSVVDNLTSVSQNLIESRSRILDTDYAAATTELARTQIIQQAGMAVLAQANQQPQAVLSLLRG
jgi:flagellin